MFAPSSAAHPLCRGEHNKRDCENAHLSFFVECMFTRVAVDTRVSTLTSFRVDVAFNFAAVNKSEETLLTIQLGCQIRSCLSIYPQFKMSLRSDSCQLVYITGVNN